MTLTLRPTMALGDGPLPALLDPASEIVQYEVEGLPPGREVLIGNDRSLGCWQVLEYRPRLGSWEGSFPTPEAALADVAHRA